MPLVLYMPPGVTGDPLFNINSGQIFQKQDGGGGRLTTLTLCCYRSMRMALEKMCGGQNLCSTLTVSEFCSAHSDSAHFDQYAGSNQAKARIKNYGCHLRGCTCCRHMQNFHGSLGYLSIAEQVFLKILKSKFILKSAVWTLWCGDWLTISRKSKVRQVFSRKPPHVFWISCFCMLDFSIFSDFHFPCFQKFP